MQNRADKQDNRTHQLYPLSTLLDMYEDKHNLEQLYRLVREVKDSTLQNSQSQQKCYYELYSKSMTIIDIFTHLLLQTNDRHHNVVEQHRENEKILQKQKEQLRIWYEEQWQKGETMRRQLIGNNQHLGTNIESLQDMLDKMKAEYDIVRKQLQELSELYTQEVKQKQTLSQELQEAVAYIQQNMHNCSIHEHSHESSITQERMLRSVKSRNSRKENTSTPSDNSTSNLLFLHSPVAGVHHQYEDYLKNKSGNSSVHQSPHLYSPSHQAQNYYNPKLIINSSIQDSAEIRDRTSFQSVQKPVILKDILNLNSSYHNTANRISSYSKYDPHSFTNERIEIEKGQIQTIQNFQQEEQEQIEGQKNVQTHQRSKDKKAVINSGENGNVIRIQDQNNGNQGNIQYSRIQKLRKRKRSTIIGEFTTGQDEKIDDSDLPSKAQSIDPYQAFFTLTVQCVKINCGHLQQAASTDLSSLWQHIITAKIPIHQWQELIKQALDRRLDQGFREKRQSEILSSTKKQIKCGKKTKLSKILKKQTKVRGQYQQMRKQVI